MYIYIDLILTDLVGDKLLPDLKYFKQSETKYKMVKICNIGRTYRHTDRQTENSIAEATLIPWIPGLSGPIRET